MNIKTINDKFNEQGRLTPNESILLRESQLSECEACDGDGFTVEPNPLMNPLKPLSVNE